MGGCYFLGAAEWAAEGGMGTGTASHKACVDSRAVGQRASASVEIEADLSAVDTRGEAFRASRGAPWFFGWPWGIRRTLSGIVSGAEAGRAGYIRLDLAWASEGLGIKGSICPQGVALNVATFQWKARSYAKTAGRRNSRSADAMMNK